MSVHGPRAIGPPVVFSGVPSLAGRAVLTQPAVTVAVVATSAVATTPRITEQSPPVVAGGSPAHDTGSCAGIGGATPSAAPPSGIGRPRGDLSAGARERQTPIDWVSLLSAPPASVTPFLRW